MKRVALPGAVALATALMACEATPPPPPPSGAHVRLRVVSGSVEDAVAAAQASANAAGVIFAEVGRDGDGVRVFIPGARLDLEEARRLWRGAVEVVSVDNDPVR